MHPPTASSMPAWPSKAIHGSFPKAHLAAWASHILTGIRPARLACLARQARQPAAPGTLRGAPKGAGLTGRLREGVVQQGTRQVAGITVCASTSGTYYTALAAGPHTVVLMLRTPMSFQYDPTADWQASRL